MVMAVNAMQSDLIDSLKTTFDNFRRSSGKERCQFPSQMRFKAVEAARAFDSVPRISKACGVAPQTLRNWMLAMPPAPRRLAVVEGVKSRADVQAPVALCTSPVPPIVAPFRFQLESGISVEASPEQTVWLIRALGGAK